MSKPTTTIIWRSPSDPPSVAENILIHREGNGTRWTTQGYYVSAVKEWRAACGDKIPLSQVKRWAWMPSPYGTEDHVRTIEFFGWINPDGRIVVGTEGKMLSKELANEIVHPGRPVRVNIEVTEAGA